jgi:hypothetical protein
MSSHDLAAASGVNPGRPKEYGLDLSKSGW